MNYIGEIISLGVAFSWTLAALFSEIGSRHLGVTVMNLWRMSLTLLFSMLLMWCFMGAPYPVYAGSEAWLWLLASGVVGYFFGDWCLFNSYLTIGSRFGQLFMTLAPAFTAVFAFALLGQTLSWHSLLAMAVTMSGIAVAVTDKAGTRGGEPLPLKGVLFGLGAALGQGLGLVLSKLGLDHYIADVPTDILPSIRGFLPFGSNLIRCLAGLVCFSVFYLIKVECGRRNVDVSLRSSFHDRRGLLAMVGAVMTGPFIGVGFSLMAVEYMAAGIASTLMATTPILILFPSRWLFGQPVTPRAVLGSVISVMGVSLFFIL
ncbi:MAG: DMT family transporter [Prevotella sp.]|nr:DMT family transporter [Prevotella sp.]